VIIESKLQRVMEIGVQLDLVDYMLPPGFEFKGEIMAEEFTKGLALWIEFNEIVKEV